MQELYSLIEAANMIGVTSAWINRTQRETGIGPKIGKKGHKVCFDTETINMLIRVKVFRLLGFGFSDIKELYSLEQEILKAEQVLSQEYELSSISTHQIPLILHPGKVMAIGPLFTGETDSGKQKLLYKDKKLESYAKYLEGLHIFAKKAAKKKDAFNKDIDDVTTVLKTIIEKFPSIYP